VVLRQENHLSVTSDYTKAWQFKLKDFTTSGAYDYYKINCIVVKFNPEQTSTFSRPGEYVRFNFGWIDYDDTNNPTETDINRQNLKL